MKEGQIRKFNRGGKFILLSKRKDSSIFWWLWDVYRFDDQRFLTYRERDLLIGSTLVCEATNESR